MKINFNTEIRLINGESLSPIMTLKDCTMNVLLSLFDDESKIPGEERAKRYVLATRIYANPEDIDLTVEEISQIKTLIGKGYSPLVVGQAWNLLEGK